MLSLHNDAIRKDNEPEPKAFTHISTPQKKISLVLQANPSIKLNNAAAVPTYRHRLSYMQ